ncbi:hypothetical protein [Akkermansia phage Chambord]|nr:hypothetical protein [Akkermansia phage Chambord]
MSTWRVTFDEHKLLRTSTFRKKIILHLLILIHFLMLQYQQNVVISTYDTD